MKVEDMKSKALNAICPYFTMFPLNFPYSILKQHASMGEWVLDPFCGRGTTNYASRILGLPSIGIDSSPVAVALSLAKLANTSPEDILCAAQQIFENNKTPVDIPTGEFWEWAYHKNTLLSICRFRDSLLENCTSDAHKALRSIILGALHGPLTKSRTSYMSNQSQRTYAPKPRYAVNFWKSHNFVPPEVNVMHVIEARAKRYYAQENSTAIGIIYQEDSQNSNFFSHIKTQHQISWVITSPPYYGMRTYIPDQWLRMWFLGGPSEVDYSNNRQIKHSSPTTFAMGLRQVWQNVGNVCNANARLIIRFGGLNDRRVNPLTIVQQSLQNTGWEINKIESAGFSSAGRRQALHMGSNKQPIEEHDIWATWHE